jgi:DNA-binding XRE family transcriptional regulator
MHKAHIEDMAKTWNHFMKGLEARAKAGGPEHLRTLRALRSHYRRMGQEVAEERKKLGMSQERLAKTTGIDQAEISRIERDLVDPRLGTYVKLLEGVGLGLRVERLNKGSISRPRQVSARRIGR